MQQSYFWLAFPYKLLLGRTQTHDRLISSCGRKRLSFFDSRFIKSQVIIALFFLKMGQPRPLLLFIFGLFKQNHYNFYNKYMWKNVQTVYGAGIWAHDLWNMSPTPITTRPKIGTGIRGTVPARYLTLCPIVSPQVRLSSDDFSDNNGQYYNRSTIINLNYWVVLCTNI